MGKKKKKELEETLNESVTTKTFSEAIKKREQEGRERYLKILNRKRNG